MHSFNVGDQVRLSQLERERSPRLQFSEGIVVGFSKGATAVQVQYPRSKTPRLLHITYLERVEGRSI